MKNVISVLLMSLFLAPVLTGCKHCCHDKNHDKHHHKMENEHGDKC